MILSSRGSKHPVSDLVVETVPWTLIGTVGGTQGLKRPESRSGPNRDSRVGRQGFKSVGRWLRHRQSNPDVPSRSHQLLGRVPSATVWGTSEDLSIAPVV
ncbi:hypothetical protein PGTUg99_028452 [Puccinia graminis f. sp. tritici]|uniref:Uncharacterized protein n=1 Tax=Puccinia graminis f. sp. tritici TaxID=56615 RepID=A0A5B0N280_PUCGR|nr:hypothetical protein PGTUg99_028452 [Puccinia graminis f. sp. tritici]